MLYLVRHGQTGWNVEPTRCQGWTDISPSEHGRTQARALANRLAGHRAGRVATSHPARARQTAGIIVEAVTAMGSPSAAAPAERTPASGAPPGSPLADEQTRRGGRSPIGPVVHERLAETRRGSRVGRCFAAIRHEDPDAWRRYRADPRTGSRDVGTPAAGAAPSAARPSTGSEPDE